MVAVENVRVFEVADFPVENDGPLLVHCRCEVAAVVHHGHVVQGDGDGIAVAGRPVGIAQLVLVPCGHDDACIDDHLLVGVVSRQQHEARIVIVFQGNLVHLVLLVVAAGIDGLQPADGMVADTRYLDLALLAGVGADDGIVGLKGNLVELDIADVAGVVLIVPSVVVQFSTDGQHILLACH